MALPAPSSTRTPGTTRPVGPTRSARSVRSARRAVPRAAVAAAITLLAGVGGAGPATASGGPAPGPDAPVIGEKVLFVGDYETGNFGQWQNCQSVRVNTGCPGMSSDRSMRILSGADARQGRFAAAYTVKVGDVPSFGGGERAEVASMAPGALVREGDERTYQWSMKFPVGFANPKAYFIVMQWHSASGSPPLAVEVNGKGELEFTSDGSGAVRFTPVRRGEWVDYVLRVKFSKDKRKGWVEAWENGQRRTPRTPMQTMKDAENYLKMGIYRGSGSTGQAEVWQDGLRVTGPADARSSGSRRPPLCTDETRPGQPCTPPL